MATREISAEWAEQAGRSVAEEMLEGPVVTYSQDRAVYLLAGRMHDLIGADSWRPEWILPCQAAMQVAVEACAARMRELVQGAP